MPVLILSAVRTPIGSLGGVLRPLSSVDLAAAVMREAVRRSGLNPGQVEEAVMGCVYAAGTGPNAAQQACVEAGLSAPAYTLNQLGGSGLRAVATAVRTLESGAAKVILAGGMDSASNAPFLLPSARWGRRMGQTELLDGLLRDGPWDPSMPLADPDPDQSMRLAAFGTESLRKAGAAQERFDREIIPLRIVNRRGTSTVTRDVGSLKTAGAGALRRESSLQNEIPGWQDGAAALVLASESFASPLRPLARILGLEQVAAGGEAPIVPALHRLLSKAGLELGSIDRFELDEIDPAATLGALSALPEIEAAKVNVRGGALALGAPLGASGARMLVTLLHILQDEELRYGVAALCTGQGQGSAVLVERIP